MTPEHYEEFIEISGRFLQDGYSIDTANNMAIIMMCRKYKLKAEYFKGIKQYE